MPDRIIRESICTSDTLNLLSDFEERFWHRLIVTCDDYGRFDARPAVLKARLFPLRENLTFKNVSDCLAKLASVGLIELYKVDGRPFLHVVTWERYQRIRAKKSKFPGPVDNIYTPRNDQNSQSIKNQHNFGECQTVDATCCQLTTNVPECEYECEYECDIRNSECEYECECEFSARPPARDSSVSVVFNAYFEKIGKSMTDRIRNDLLYFLNAMGPECCIRAIDAAVEANKISWYYVKRVLENKQKQGVHCIADWDALESRREEEKNGKIKHSGSPSSPSLQGWRAKSALDDPDGDGTMESG